MREFRVTIEGRTFEARPDTELGPAGHTPCDHCAARPHCPGEVRHLEVAAWRDCVFENFHYVEVPE